MCLYNNDSSNNNNKADNIYTNRRATVFSFSLRPLGGNIQNVYNVWFLLYYWYTINIVIIIYYR